MNCGGCGRPVSGDWEFCEYCGHSIRGKEKPVQSRPPAKSRISTTTIIIIVVVVIVVAPVVLSAVLYFMVLGFGTNNIGTPTASLTKSEETNGFRFTFGPITSNVYWNDVAIHLDDGVQTCEWWPSTDSLDGDTLDTQSFEEVSLGALTIYCSVTDLTGNGCVNSEDYFILTTPSASPFNVATTYVVTIVFEPSEDWICRSYFSG